MKTKFLILCLSLAFAGHASITPVEEFQLQMMTHAADHSTTHRGSHHFYALPEKTVFIDQIWLEDGSLWFVFPQERSKVLDWRPADPLALLAGNSPYRFRIHNEYTNQIVDVELSAAPFLDSFYRLTIKYIDVDQRYLLLSDGSKWILPNNNWIEQEVWMKWYIGDTIIIGTNDEFFNSYFRPDLLINITCSATYTPSKCVN